LTIEGHRVHLKKIEEGEMKKGMSAMLLLVFVLGAAPVMFGEDMRIYNDGEIDYVPLQASFVLSAEDDESTVKEIRYSINGSGIEVYQEPITLTEEGRQLIVYWAIDMTDNVSSEKLYSVIVDATPPDGFVSVHGPAFTVGDALYITGQSRIVLWAEDELAGVDAIYVSLDDSSFMEYREPVSITKEGYHEASAYAVDNVGNATDVFSVAGYVDSTPPSVTVTARDAFVEVEGRNYTNKDNTYTVTAEDEYAGLQEILVSLDGSDYAVYSAPFRVQIRGEHTISAKAVDRLGNESSPVDLRFYVDVTPPSTSMGVSLEE
jgi:hypothetical protein